MLFVVVALVAAILAMFAVAYAPALEAWWRTRHDRRPGYLDLTRITQGRPHSPEERADGPNNQGA